MKAKAILLFLLVTCSATYAESSTDSIFKALHKAIQEKKQYARQKQNRISALKRIVLAERSPLKVYAVNQDLYEEYRKFKIDSAISFTGRNLKIARHLKDRELEVTAQIQLAELYSSSGQYRESEIAFRQARKAALPEKILSRYYEAYIQFFEHYATNSHSEVYGKQAEIYRDSLLAVLSPTSVEYKIHLSQKNIYNGRLVQAQKELLSLLGTIKKRDKDYAMAAYLLGDIYKKHHDLAQQKRYFAIAAITDIKNAIKDNAAIQNLALIYYEAGDIDNAYKYTQSAIEDAIFCNVQFRTLRMSELFSIINTAYSEKEGAQKKELKSYLILITLLSVFLTTAIIYLYRQMKKIFRIKEELDHSSQKLSSLNQEIRETNVCLSEINVKLSEANHVKEVYIAQFFDLCSTYIDKLENYRKTLNKKANEKHLDELFKMLRSNSIVNNEVEALYKVFDDVFLKLYPNFIDEFNALLIPEEQVTVKAGELLNTELRIFALIRLGITDSVKIAAFLRYSLSTIYNYRTKTRNKAAVSRDDFEKRVIKIGILPVNQ